MAKIILGIDAGFSNTGITAMLVNKGKLRLINTAVYTTEKDNRKKSIRQADDDIERLKKLTNNLQDFIIDTQSFMQRKFGSTNFRYFAAVEFPTGGARGARPGRCMGMATGHLVAFLMMNGISFEIVTPKQVKEISSNVKSVSKGIVIQSVLSFCHNNNICEIDYVKDKHGWIYTIKNIDGYYYRIISGKFEHIADSIAAIKFVKSNSQMYKLFIGV
jgi:hypothetical protein